MPRGPLRRDDDQLHRLARGAEQQLARDGFVESLEVDLGEYHARRRLSLEAVDRLEQHVAFAVFGVAEQIVLARETAQSMRPEVIQRAHRRALAAAKRQHHDVLLAKAERERLRD